MSVAVVIETRRQPGERNSDGTSPRDSKSACTWVLPGTCTHRGRMSSEAACDAKQRVYDAIARDVERRRLVAPSDAVLSVKMRTARVFCRNRAPSYATARNPRKEASCSSLLMMGLLVTPSVAASAPSSGIEK